MKETIIVLISLMIIGTLSTEVKGQMDTVKITHVDTTKVTTDSIQTIKITRSDTIIVYVDSSLVAQDTIQSDTLKVVGGIEFDTRVYQINEYKDRNEVCVSLETGDTTQILNYIDGEKWVFKAFKKEGENIKPIRPTRGNAFRFNGRLFLIGRQTPKGHIVVPY